MKNRKSIRLPNSDYSMNGGFFITICTKNRECIFGEIKNGHMVLNETGMIVQDEWEKSFKIRLELLCPAYIVMPNHIHAIVIIDRGDDNRRDARPCVPTKFGIAKRMPKSISSFVAGFKSSATKRINIFRNQPGIPVWQSRYYDRIIRNSKEFNNIENYIINNPANWREDESNPEYKKIA